MILQNHPKAEHELRAAQWYEPLDFQGTKP